MRKLLTSFFLLYALFARTQNIQVLSAKDSLRVSFASLLISNESINYSKTANDDGLIVLSHKFSDSALYQVTIQCFGFEKFSGKYYGYQLGRLGRIYLSPSQVKLDEVVITAQYEPTEAEKSVQKIRVIDKEKIQQMGAVNLRDVLTNQMNIRLQQDNILGSGMTMQGISGENVKILIDGVPVIGRLNGNIDLSQINMDNVERIELVEGPLSVQYGTNALAGTINVITKKGGGQKRVSAGVTGYYESIGTYNLNADAMVSHNRHNFQFSGGRNFFDGWKSGEQPFQLPRVQLADSGRYRQWKPKEQYFATLAYQYAFRRTDIGLKSSWFDEVIRNRGYPMAPYGETTFDDYYYTRRIDNSLSIRSRLSSNWKVNSLTAFNYYNRVKKTLYKDLTTLEEELSANSSDHDTSSFTLFMTRASFIRSSAQSRLNYELGYDLNYESALGRRVDKHLQYMGDYAVFATAEYKPIKNFVIKPGLRYAYNTVYTTPLIPSLNLRYIASDHHTIRASFARGFRAPSIKELYFYFYDINHNIIGNKDLRAEQSDNYSLSYNYNRDIKKCRVKFDVSMFYNSIFNLITLAQVNSVDYSYINIGRFRTFGVQFSNSLNFKRLMLQTGFNYSARYNQLSAEYGVPGYNYTPEVLGNLNYRFIKARLNLAVFYKYSGRLPGYALSNGEVIQTSINDYQIMDATLSWVTWKGKATLTLGCKNLFNVTNVTTIMAGGGAHSTSATSMPMGTGRNYFVKLAFNISKS